MNIFLLDSTREDAAPFCWSLLTAAAPAVATAAWRVLIENGLMMETSAIVMPWGRARRMSPRASTRILAPSAEVLASRRGQGGVCVMSLRHNAIFHGQRIACGLASWSRTLVTFPCRRVLLCMQHGHCMCTSHRWSGKNSSTHAAFDGTACGMHVVGM
jgi:hypothetical protein